MNLLPTVNARVLLRDPILPAMEPGRAVLRDLVDGVRGIQGLAGGGVPNPARGVVVP